MKHRIKILIILILISSPISLYSKEKIEFERYENIKAATYKTGELINYLSKSSIDEHFEKVAEWYYIAPEVVTELQKRQKDVHLLLEAFSNPTDDTQLKHIVDVLYPMDDKRINAAFKKYINSNELSETMYYCLNYLAKQGDMEALKILNKNYFKYPVSSWQWSYTVELFGKYHYIQATENLLTSLDAASLNVVDAAFKSLFLLYPDAPRKFDTPEEAVKVLKKYIAQKN